MKKELLLASALVSTMGFASVANAVTATMSGMHASGLQGDDTDAAADAIISHDYKSDFTVSLSETTDGGIGISSSFMLANENAALHTAGLTLTFTDGSKLDVINGGNAAASHDVSIPGSAGSPGVTVTSANNAQTGLDFFNEATVVGVEWHSAADFMADGLKVSASISLDDGTAAAATAALESSWGLGATYVTSAGDTAITVGAGVADSEFKDSGQDVQGSNGFHVGFSAVTGDLTVAAGYADGDKIRVDPESAIFNNSVSSVGVKYVTGDVTLSAGFTSAEGDDNTSNLTSASGSDDTKDITSLGISYAVASGVTANLGWKDIDAKDDGANDTTGGSSWYVGATMSF